MTCQDHLFSSWALTAGVSKRSYGDDRQCWLQAMYDCGPSSGTLTGGGGGGGQSNGDVVSSTPAVSFFARSEPPQSPNETEITNPNATSKKPLQGPNSGPAKNVPLNIASLNVTNISTNLNFVKHLSSVYAILFLQETWLYNYQKKILFEVYNNTEFVAGCVDDNDPVGPSLHSRSYGGTCILWRSNLNPRIKCLPESSERINVVGLRADSALFCLVNSWFSNGWDAFWW